VPSLVALPIIDEAFDYGSSDAQSNYGEWSDSSNNVRYESGDNGNWSGDGDYVDPDLGGSLRSSVTPTDDARGAQLAFDSSLTGELWLSALIRDDSSRTAGTETNFGTYLGFDNDGSYSIAAPNLQGFGINGLNNLLITTGDNLTDTGIALSDETWLLFVAQVTVNASADDSLQLWVFDSTSEFGTDVASLGTPTYTSSTMDFGDEVLAIWGGARKASDDTIARGYIDNIRISIDPGDSGVAAVIAAVPEPGTVTMVIVGFFGLVFLRRRWS